LRQFYMYGHTVRQESLVLDTVISFSVTDRHGEDVGRVTFSATPEELSDPLVMQAKLKPNVGALLKHNYEANKSAGAN